MAARRTKKTKKSDFKELAKAKRLSKKHLDLVKGGFHEHSLPDSLTSTKTTVQ